jgi:hypothetical protein
MTHPYSEYRRVFGRLRVFHYTDDVRDAGLLFEELTERGGTSRPNLRRIRRGKNKGAWEVSWWSAKKEPAQ